MKSSSKSLPLVQIAGAGLLAALGFSAVWRAGRRISFARKVVLITGGSRGLGLAMAREFAREKARLVLLARDPDELARAEADLRKRGAEVLTIVCDVCERAQVTAAIRETLRQFGALDVLVNNAGTIIVGPLETMTTEDYEKAMAIHLWAPLHLMQTALPYLRRSRGRIVNICSIGGKIAVPHLAPYVASKFALRGLSSAFAAELAKDGICVTTVCPGLMRTGSHINAQFKGEHSAEFAWFSLGAATPLTSMDGERAARQIVDACRCGRSEVVLTFQARLAALAGAVFPELTTAILGVVNRFLPASSDAQNPPRRGGEVRGDFPSREMTQLADEASAEFNELGS